ncbi:MAG TPA: branched-chain amino acid ABC transporter permease [Mycobacteriales bacterium]|nr:branched-chain amino acid ABC transporter permease [Mycobacteriales bacterium]
MCFQHNFWPLFVSGIENGSVYALVALGYTLVYGVLQLINFAHSEVFMSGAFGGLFAVQAVVGSSTPSGWASVGYIALGIAAGAVVGGIAAFVLERVAYRPLRRRGAPPLAFLISAIGASFFALNLAGKEFGSNPISVPQLYQEHALFHIFGAPVLNTYVIIVCVALGFYLIVDRVIAKTRLGQGIRAVAQDAETASLMGVNVERIIVATFVLGGLLGGAGGFLYGVAYNVQFNMGFFPGLKAFTAAVLGGIGNIRGAVVGGLLLGVIEALGVSCIQTEWSDTIAFLVLVLVLMVKPTGLFGESLGRAA